MNKFKIKKNDMVLVLAGNDKDKRGANGKFPAPHKVLKVLVDAQKRRADTCGHKKDRGRKESPYC